MPLIQVKLMEAFMPTQKKEIVGQLTGAVVSIEEKDIGSVTWVTIEEDAAVNGASAGRM